MLFASCEWELFFHQLANESSGRVLVENKYTKANLQSVCIDISDRGKVSTGHGNVDIAERWLSDTKEPKEKSFYAGGTSCIH